LAQDDIKAKHLWEKSYKWLAPLLGIQLNAFSEAMGTFAFDEAKGILETVEGIHAIGISTPESTTNPTAA
jgi:hypothetical protein